MNEQICNTVRTVIEFRVEHRQHRNVDIGMSRYYVGLVPVFCI